MLNSMTCLNKQFASLWPRKSKFNDKIVSLEHVLWLELENYKQEKPILMCGEC